MARSRRRGPVAAGAVLLIVGCAACASTAKPAAAPGPGIAAPGAAYLALANPANHRLDSDFDHLEDDGTDDLPAAQADLRDAAAAEHAFDRGLAALALPPQAEAVSRALVWVNEYRADLTGTAASAPSLNALHGYDLQRLAANKTVERLVTAIRQQLGLPTPPDAS
jgi:hypothetical protein